MRSHILAHDQAIFHFLVYANAFSDPKGPENIHLYFIQVKYG